VLVFLITRHGARTPYDIKEQNEGFSDKWPTGRTALTPVGERQHYLIGSKIREKYIKELHLLNEKYDPRELHIISTDYNRTIMSGISETFGLYKEPSAKLTEEQQKHALPPFHVKNQEQILEDLGDTPTKSGLQHVPIHVSFEIEKFLKGCDTAI